MTDNIRYSTSHLHEFAAKIQQMSFEGYVLDTRSTFAAKRMGSAYVCWFVPTREVLDFSDITVLDSEQAEQILDNPPEVNEKLKDLLFMDSNNPHVQAAAKLRELKNDPEKIKQLTIQQKWEAEETLNELTQQSQELGMYDVDGRIFKRIVESIESAQNNPEGCVSTIVEIDKGQVKVYSKSELENMEWSEFKKLIDAAGIRGRRRQNLTRDYLIYQEENLK